MQRAVCVPWMAAVLTGLVLAGGAHAAPVGPTSRPVAPDLLSLAPEEQWLPSASADPNAAAATVQHAAAATGATAAPSAAGTPAASPAAPDGASAAAATTAPAAAATGTESDVLRRPGGREDRLVAARSESSGGGWLQTLGALGTVLGLMALLVWGYRLVNGASGRLGAAGRGRRAHLIEIVARTPLAPRQTLCLVRLGPRLVLLGVGPTGVTTLHVEQDAAVVAALLGQSAQAGPDSRTAAFEQCLQQEAATYTSDEPALPELPVHETGASAAETPAPSLAGAVARLRRRLGAS